MIKANFNTYASYVTDSLYQWDLNQTLSVTGLNLAVVPEVHFSNANMDRAIVRQATIVDHVVKVAIPNSLLQDPLTIRAHIGIYEGDTFKVVELVEIPVIARTRPFDYQFQDSDEEIYSFNRIENEFNNINARIENRFNEANATIENVSNNINATIENVSENVNDHVENKENPHGVTAQQVGALPITGGTLEGDLYFSEGHGNNIYGDHNKPGGNYTGNGDATSRTIDIGGKGALLVITSDVGTALVTSRGAICHERSGTTVTGVVSWEVEFQNGKLKITTANDLLNKADQKYYYQVI